MIISIHRATQELGGGSKRRGRAWLIKIIREAIRESSTKKRPGCHYRGGQGVARVLRKIMRPKLGEGFQPVDLDIIAHLLEQIFLEGRANLDLDLADALLGDPPLLAKIQQASGLLSDHALIPDHPVSRVLNLLAKSVDGGLNLR